MKVNVSMKFFDFSAGNSKCEQKSQILQLLGLPIIFDESHDWKIRFSYKGKYMYVFACIF